MISGFNHIIVEHKFDYNVSLPVSIEIPEIDIQRFFNNKKPIILNLTLYVRPNTNLPYNVMSFTNILTYNRMPGGEFFSSNVMVTPAPSVITIAYNEENIPIILLEPLTQ